MPDPTIITLTAYPDIFEQFYRSVEQYEPEAQKIAVVSGHFNGTVISTRWQMFRGPEPFCFSRNANLGIKACKGDVLLVNDDVQFLRSGSLKDLQSTMELFSTQHRIGIISPQISGVVGNFLQSYETRIPQVRNRVRGGTLAESKERLCFVCVYIKREVFEEIGYLDESFTGYGRDDDDFCRRAQEAGWKLTVTPDVIVRHGFEDTQWSSSYRRAMGEEEYSNAVQAADHHYCEKWRKLRPEAKPCSNPVSTVPSK